MKKLFVLFALMVIASTSYAQVYKMYKTRNYHNQLRLNTMTGEVQQIQDDGQSWEICSAREILGDKEGRFRLYETQNMWTFIMLDTYTGKNWQVQFSVNCVRIARQCTCRCRIYAFGRRQIAGRCGRIHQQLSVANDHFGHSDFGGGGVCHRHCCAIHCATDLHFQFRKNVSPYRRCLRGEIGRASCRERV